MPLFNSRGPTSDLDGILETVSLGDCDDRTIDRVKVLAEVSDSKTVDRLAEAMMANLVRYPDSIPVLTGSVKVLEVLPFLPEGKNEFIITLMLSLLKAPVNRKDALQQKVLKTEIMKFLLSFVAEDMEYARLMMPELIASMDDMHGIIGSNSFHVLQELAAKKPEYFQPYSANLIKLLGSINKSARAESAKLIGIIGKNNPEYVSNAVPFLQSLASFYPDSHVKRNAGEAYQVILSHQKKDAPHAKTPEKPAAPADVKGLFAIVNKKASASEPQAAADDQPVTEDELKAIIDSTKKEFSSDAEALLNSLGVGHLAMKGKKGAAKAPKAEVAPKAKKAPAPVPKQEAKPARHADASGPERYYKCPKCGRRTRVEGKPCKICSMGLESTQPTIACIACGTMNVRSAKECRKCGARIESAMHASSHSNADF